MTTSKLFTSDRPPSEQAASAIQLAEHFLTHMDTKLIDSSIPEYASKFELDGTDQRVQAFFRNAMMNGMVNVCALTMNQVALLKRHIRALQSAVHEMRAKYKDTPTVMSDMQPLLDAANTITTKYAAAARKLLIDGATEKGIPEAVLIGTDPVSSIGDEQLLVIAAKFVQSSMAEPLAALLHAIAGPQSVESRVRLGRQIATTAVQTYASIAMAEREALNGSYEQLDELLAMLGAQHVG